MGRFQMGRFFACGAIGALLSISAAEASSAQGVIAVPRRGGDSIVVRAFGLGKMDTIVVLTRAMGREEYGSPAWLQLSRKVDSLLTGLPRVMIRQNVSTGPTARNVPRGWLGFNAQGPSLFDGERVTYFAYPQILSVDPASPADRAGIIPGDVLVAFNGTDVFGHEFDLSRLIVPDKKVSVTIRRDGEMKEFPLDIVRVPQGVFDRRMAFRLPVPPGSPEEMAFVHVEPDGEGVSRGGGRVAAGARGATTERMIIARGGPMSAGGYVVIGQHAILGADVSTVSPELARALKLDKGVLVNAVPDASPAYKSGLRVGDVIISSSGRPVATLVQLQDDIINHFAERSVLLHVMRDRKPTKITVTW
jgi:hypothetical protein